MQLVLDIGILIVNRTLTAALSAGLVMLIGLFSTAHAVAPANVPLSIKAFVNYDGMSSEAPSATVSITVDLSPAAPQLSAPVDQEQVQEEGAPPTVFTYTYTITSRANGSDSYTLETTYEQESLLGDPTVRLELPDRPGLNLVSMELGATAAHRQRIQTQKELYVPYDGTNDDDVSAIKAGDTIYIGRYTDESVLFHGPYVVESVQEDQDGGSNYSNFSIINLEQGLLETVYVGDSIVESKTFNLVITDLQVDPDNPAGLGLVDVTVTPQPQGFLVRTYLLSIGA